MYFFLLILLQAPPAMRGEYLCHGVTPQGSYDVLLSVEKKSNNYLVTWHDIAIKAKGLGLRSDNTLAVYFVSDKGQHGVALYNISLGGLEGTWAVGDGKVYTETCTLGWPSKA